MPKKSVLCLSAALLLFGGALAYYMYCAYHPSMLILRSESDGGNRFEEEYHSETIWIVLADHNFIPLAKSANENVKELCDWNLKVTTDLYENYIAPYNVKVSGEVAKGKTTLCYEGYVTTKDGETIDYKEERTFDFAYVSNEDLFQNREFK